MTPAQIVTSCANGEAEAKLVRRTQKRLEKQTVAKFMTLNVQAMQMSANLESVCEKASGTASSQSR